MKDLNHYNSILALEWDKLKYHSKALPGLGILLSVFAFSPWLTLHGFEEKLEEYSWWYLDDSVLNFIIYSSTNRCSWLMILVIPWLFIILFSKEPQNFVRKRNRIFIHLISSKSLFFILFVGAFTVLSATSTFWLYRFWCQGEMLQPAPGDLPALLSSFSNIGIRYVLVIPLIVLLFLFVPHKWNYSILLIIFIFSSLAPFDTPYQFHYNLQHPHFNLEGLQLSLGYGAIITGIILIYFRFISKPTRVFP